MKKRTSGGLLAVVVASFIAPACGSSLPHENGVVWECAGTAVDQDLQGNQQVIAIIGTGAVEIHECADRGTDRNEVNSACKDDCESKFGRGASSRKRRSSITTSRAVRSPEHYPPRVAAMTPSSRSTAAPPTRASRSTKATQR